MTTSNPIVGGTTLSTLSSSRGVLPSPGIQVLIPQHVPGPFYYPPCKCDLVNQVSTYLLIFNYGSDHLLPEHYQKNYKVLLKYFWKSLL